MRFREREVNSGGVKQWSSGAAAVFRRHGRPLVKVREGSIQFRLERRPSNFRSEFVCLLPPFSTCCDPFFEDNFRHHVSASVRPSFRCASNFLIFRDVLLFSFFA